MFKPSSPDRATIREVAVAAGVSTMSVSRTLNGTGYVSAEVRARVLQAVEETGYAPNQLARGLRSQKTGTIALVVTDITNPFFTTVARGVEDAARAAQYLVLLCNTDESEEEERKYLQLLAGKRVDGVLLVPSGHSANSLAIVRRNHLPLVILDRRISDATVDVVRCDSYAGSAAIARYLSDLGHTAFAVLAGPEGVSTSDDRVAGFASGLPSRAADRVVVYHGNYDQVSGHRLAGRVLREQPQITAIFAANNFLLIGAMQELSQRSVDVPGQISLAGFDDLPPEMVASPFLTVVAQPAYEMGRVALLRLQQRIENKDDAGGVNEVVLPTEIAIRGSCARPRPG